MDLAIIGLEMSGKTTLFRAVTRGHAASASYGALEPNLGVVKVPDDRLDRLSALLNSRKITHLELRWLDFPGSLSLRGEAPPAYLAALAQCDALVHVVRAFRDESVPHPQGGVDADRDIASVNLELAYGDAAALERRHERLEISVRSGRPGEREAGERELVLLQRLREALEREEPLRAQELTPDERRLISGYQLLTNKPLLLAVNADEADVAGMSEIESDMTQRWAGPSVEVVALCAKLEQELAELSDEEAAEFRSDMGLSEDGAGRLAQAAQRVLGLLAFFTVGETEGRAWALPGGGTALDAANKIHSDIARGFIRAEVIGWQAMLDCGSWAEARKRGLLRTEGKQYVVKDGELINILFNV
jgi:GTP-binding protein YchF